MELPRFAVVSRVFFTRAGAGLALIALALLGAAPAVLKDNPHLAYALFGAVFLLGVAAVVMAIITELAFIDLRDELGEMYAEGRELLERHVKSESEFAEWKLRSEEWHSGVIQMLRRRLSPAHAWLFQGEPLRLEDQWPGQWGPGGDEHYRKRNIIHFRLANLHRIIDRFLTTRT